MMGPALGSGVGHALATVGAPAELPPAVAELPTAQIVLGLVGGLALFLFGMDVLTKGLRKLASGRMRRLLAGMTYNRATAFLSGFLATAGLQSSSVTTVLVIGFVSAGLLTFVQTIGIIAGANVGTAVTAQIIAFRIAEYAPLLLGVGYLLTLWRPRRVPYRVGQMLVGLGLLFLGMHLMSEGLGPLRDYAPFRDSMTTFDVPIAAVLLGAVFTALIQASAAAIAILITLVAEDLVSVQTAIAMLIGVNIGTCSTTLLATVGKRRDATRVAAVHLVFNVAGAIVWVPLLGTLVAWSIAIAPTADGARAIANAHGIFNLSTAVVFLLVTPAVAWIITKLLPDRPEKGGIVPKHLEAQLLEAPPLALEAARLEAVRFGRKVVYNLRRAFDPILGDERETTLEQIWQYDDRLDRLHAAIVSYLSRIGEEELSSDDSRVASELMDIVNSLAQISDIVVGDLVRLGYERREQGVESSPRTVEILRTFHELVAEAIDVAVETVRTLDTVASQTVRQHKEDVNRIADKAAEHLQRRLTAQAPRRMVTYAFETKLVEHLRRIYYFAKRIGDTVEEIAPDFPSRRSARRTATVVLPKTEDGSTSQADVEAAVVADDERQEATEADERATYVEKRKAEIHAMETRLGSAAASDSGDSVERAAPAQSSADDTGAAGPG